MTLLNSPKLPHTRKAARYQVFTLFFWKWNEIVITDLCHNPEIFSLMTIKNLKKLVHETFLYNSTYLFIKEYIFVFYVIFILENGRNKNNSKKKIQGPISSVHTCTHRIRISFQNCLYFNNRYVLMNLSKMRGKLLIASYIFKHLRMSIASYSQRCLLFESSCRLCL